MHLSYLKMYKIARPDDFIEPGMLFVRKRPKFI